MRLTSFDAGVPVFAVRSEVGHVTPRVPTVFEKMVMRLVAAAQGQGELGGMSLRTAFADVLGVADAPRLLRPCIEELQALQVLVAPQVQEPLEAPLSAWTLTARGRDFWGRGLVPRRASYEMVVHSYDPVSGELGVWRDTSVEGRPPVSHLDGTLPRLDLGPLVSGTLQHQRPPWYKPGTEIFGVQANVVDMRWRTVALHLDVAADGTLALTAASDDLFNAWLRDAQPEVVWERLVAPALGGEKARVEHCDPALSLAGKIVLSPVVGDLGIVPKAPARQRWSLVVLAGEEPLPVTPAPAVDLVHLRLPAPSLSPWAPPRQVLRTYKHGHPLSLDTPARLPVGLRRIVLDAPGATPQAWVEGAATLYWGGQGRMVRLRAELESPQAQAAWAVVRSALDDWLTTQSSPDAMAIAAWTEFTERAVAQWLRATAGRAWRGWFSELAMLLACLQQRLAMPPAMLAEQPWVAALEERCARVVDRAGSVLTLSECIELLEVLRDLPLRQPALARLVLSRVTAREDVADLKKLRQALGDPSVILPASLLDTPLRQVLLHAALAFDGREDETSSPIGPHELHTPLQVVSAAYRQARREVPVVLFDPEGQSSKAGRQAMRIQPARTLSALAALEQALAEGLAALNLSESALPVPLARLQELRNTLVAQLAPPLSQGRRAVVIDTNALLEVPDLFDRMPAQDVPVVARAVVEELDGLKKSQVFSDPDAQARADRTAQQARRASRALEAAGERVLLERPRREQCAADLPATRDYEILAVAAYHALSPALLLSADRNLRQVARSEGVPTKTPQDYLKNSGQPEAPAQPSLYRSTF